MAASSLSGTTTPRGLRLDLIQWQLVPARDIFRLEYGRALVENTRRPGDVPVYGTNGRCGTHDQALFRGPGVILGRKGQGPLGVEWCDSDYWVIDTAYALVPIRPDVDLKFAYYLIKYIGLNHLKDGTSNPTLSRDSFGAQALPLPPLKQQRAIAQVLGWLDDKIELNRRMNETLEAMAQALFKSWFVDFDPVRAKAEGRDPGIPSHIADLFPHSLADSELGHIPSGWTVDGVYSIADVIYGAPYKSAFFNGDKIGQPLIRIRDLGSSAPDIFTTEELPRGYLVQPGDLIVGMDGEFRAHIWCGPEAWLNQRLCCFKPKADASRAFVHYSIERLLDFFERSKTGTTVIHLGKGDIDTFRVIVPSPEILRCFGAIAGAADARVLKSAQQSATLDALRDTLLPRLMSGELRIKDAERFMERAGA